MFNLSVIRNFGIRGKGFSSPDNYIIRTLKAIHLLSATAWAGGALGLQALSYLKFTIDDPVAINWIAYALHFVDTWVVIPGLFGCILTGLFYSCFTALGFFKYAWIYLKWLVACFAACFGLLFWSQYGEICLQNLSPYGLDVPLKLIRGIMIPEKPWQGAIQLISILGVCLISVYRPLSIRSIILDFIDKWRSDKKEPAAPVIHWHASWFNQQIIIDALNRRGQPDKEELNDILQKSLALETLTPAETVALTRVTANDSLRLMFKTADMVKRKVYGDRIVMSAPLHISNRCANECLYCAYRKSNSAIKRTYLNLGQMESAALKLIDQGLRRVFIVSGQFPNADVEFLVNAIHILSTANRGQHKLSRVSINVGALKAEEYAALRSTPVGTILLYQDTYHEASYHAAHTVGPKSDFAMRLAAADVAQNAGFHDTGLGIVLGLGPWQYDILGLLLHASHLMEVYGSGSRSVSMHRLRPAPGCSFATPYPVSDATYLRAIAITRLAIPYTSLIVTSKETAGLWRQACSLGASHLLTGSVANPYESWQTGLENIQFPIGEDCHIDAITQTLMEEDLLPSFCAACPTVGRSGDRFTSAALVGDLKKHCAINSMATFMDYLLSAASAETKTMGEAFVAKRLAQMSSENRAVAERLIRAIQKKEHSPLDPGFSGFR